MTKSAQIFIQWIVTGLAFALLASCSPKPQNDCGFVQNIYGQRISWKKQGAVKLHINASVPVALRQAIYRAAATWDQQIGYKIFEVVEDVNTVATAKPERDSKNAIYFLSDWESDRNTEQGRTSVYWVGDQIQEADIRINAADFSYYDQNPSVLVGSLNAKKQGRAVIDGYSLEALLLHEMGHLLGLKHREESGTVMATHLAAYTNRTQLAASDLESLTCEYKK
jgi:Matrixin